MAYDVHFHFDPVCQFAWLTSKWVREVAALRGYSVDWRFISLRIINKDVDYASHFPKGYERGHQQGLDLLRVSAAVRAAEGRDVVGDLYQAITSQIFDVEPTAAGPARRRLAEGDGVRAALAEIGLDLSYADALHDTTWDVEIAAECEEALTKTGRDVGTPIIGFEPPDGPYFFGPVISRVPRGDDALRLWDLIVELAAVPGFSELKRSLRETPQLRAFGISEATIGAAEDWHQGSRKLKR